MSFASSSNVGLYVQPRTGNVGIGTTLPKSGVHIGGNLILGNTGYTSYTSTTSNVILPTGSGTINGVNITELNKRTRTSYASAVECVRTWTARTSAVDNFWTSVCWAPELSLFVAVGQSGTGNRVMTSPDGVSWTIRTSADNTQWSSVCWSPKLSLLVAVASFGIGSSNLVMTSSNGINWTAYTGAGDGEWESVCWSPELSIFVAVGYSGTGYGVMTSPDGINWTAQTSANSSAWVSVCWSPELSIFVAVAGFSASGNNIMVSSNGINWTAYPSIAGVEWGSVCWSPELGLFLAVSSQNKFITSPDGINWTQRSPAANNSWKSVCWSAELSLFITVALSGTGNRVMTSPDGINWTTRTSAADNAWRSICWAPELSIFVAVASSGTGNRVMTSAIGMPNAKSVVKALPSQMMVDANGNVGIGTTNPQSTLDITSNIIIRAPTSGSTSVNELMNIFTRTNTQGGGAIIRFNYGSYPTHLCGAAIASFLSTFNGKCLAFYTADGNVVPGSEVERMRIAANGYVGIGTNNPIQALDVYGNVRIGISASTSSHTIRGKPYIYSTHNASVPSYDPSYSDFGDLTIINETTGRMLHLGAHTGYCYLQSVYPFINAESFVLQPAGGSVGIGITNPSEKLHVSGNIDVGLSTNNDYRVHIRALSYPTLRFTEHGNGGNEYNLYLYNNILRLSRYGVENVNFLASGQLNIRGTLVQNAFSDRRLKTNIKPIQNALSKISALKGCMFDYKIPRGDVLSDSGFIAQEFQEVFPQWITDGLTTKEEQALLGENEKAMNFSTPPGFFAYLVEAIKELHQKVNDLQNEVYILKYAK